MTAAERSGRAYIALGATHGAAIAPFAFANGPIRPATDLDALRADAERIDRIFQSCPIQQWSAAAIGVQA